MKYLILSSCLFFLGCSGYHLGSGSSPPSGSTLSIPYIQGDYDGALTAALIRELERCREFVYCKQGGHLLLKVEVLNRFEENIGFQYDENDEGETTTSIIPVESRDTLVAQVQLIDCHLGCAIFGPIEISASLDYDHVYTNGESGVNVFSLGQLSDIDVARDSVLPPLYKRLSQKIVDALCYSFSW